MAGMAETARPSLRGRQAEALRNDERVLEAAREVLTAHPRAPMSAVAAHAGVGQASLYRRYRSREELLAQVCVSGMGRMRDAALEALERDDDPWDALSGFLDWYLDSGTPQLAALVGSFRPAEELFVLARETNEAMQALVDRAARAGALRDDVGAADLTLLVTMLSGLRHGSAARGAELRVRYLALIKQALTLRDAEVLPGPAPRSEELVRPWRRQ